MARPGPLAQLQRASRPEHSRVLARSSDPFFQFVARPRVLTFTSRDKRSRYDKTVDAGVLDQNLPYPNRLMHSCRKRLIKNIKFLIFGPRDTTALYATPTHCSPSPSSLSPGLDFVSLRFFIILNISLSPREPGVHEESISVLCIVHQPFFCLHYPLGRHL